MKRTVALVVATASLWPSQAGAGNKAAAHCALTGCSSLARTEPDARRPPARRSTTCTYRAPIAVPANMTVYRVDGTPIRPDGDGHWVERDCRRADGSLSVTPVFVRPRPPAPAVLAQEARGYLAPAAPASRLAPAGQQTTNLATWLWIDPAAWVPITSVVEVAGLSVSVVATPVRTRWAMGDGAVVTCAGPGTPWDPARPDAVTDCSHTYRRSSVGQPGDAYRLVVSIDYAVAWSVTGAAGGGALAPISVSSAPVAVAVGEIQAIGTPRRNG